MKNILFALLFAAAFLAVHAPSVYSATSGAGGPANPPMIAAGNKKPEEKKDDEKPVTKPGHPRPYKDVINAIRTPPHTQTRRHSMDPTPVAASCQPRWRSLLRPRLR